MTCLKVSRLLLISIDSLVATLPVWDWRSLPAKSTSCSALTIVLSGYLPSMHSRVIFSIEWEREDALFMLCEATTLFLIPKW